MAIWPLLHRLFGWDYVHIRHGQLMFIRRVRRTTAGERYVRRTGVHLVFIDRQDCRWTVTALTEPRPAAIILPLHLSQEKS